MSNSRLISGGVLVLGLAFYLLTIRPGHRAGDFSMLLQHAINMVDGRPYAQTTFVQNPDAISVGTTSYPPGIPLLIAPLYAIFGLNLFPMKVLMVLMFFASLLVFGLTTERLVPWPFFTLMAVDLCFTPYFWEFKDNVESDFPFLLPLFLVIYLIAHRDAATPASVTSRRSIIEDVGIGLLIYVAVAMRSIGLVLLISLFLDDLLQRRRWLPSRRVWITAATVFGLMAIQSAILKLDSGTYGAAFAEYAGSPTKFIGSVILNIKYYLLAVTGRILMTNGHGTLWADVLLLLCIGPFLAGLWQRIRHQPGILEVFTVTYSGILILWPFRQPNYLIPLVPLLAFYLFSGLAYMTRNFSPGRRNLVGAGVLVLLLATYIPRYMTLPFDRIPHDIMSNASMEFFEWVRTDLDPDEGIITRLPREVALFTEHPATAARHPAKDPEHYTLDEADAVHERAVEMGFSYVAAGPRGFQFHQEILPLWNLLDDRPEMFEGVWENEEWRVVKFR